jgi:hypothetical protein
MTAGVLRDAHNLIERFIGDKAESLDLDFSYHLEISFLAYPNGKKHGFNPATVQPDWTINHHNPTEQLRDCWRPAQSP